MRRCVRVRVHVWVVGWEDKRGLGQEARAKMIRAQKLNMISTSVSLPGAVGLEVRVISTIMS